MKRSTITVSVAATGAALICLVYLLLPGVETPGLERPEETPAPPPARLATAKPPDEAPGVDVARASEAEQKIRELEAKLAEAEAKGAERRQSKAPFADPEMKKAMQSEAASGVERGVAARFDAGLAEELQLTEEQREVLRELLTQRGSIVWEQILIPMAAGELDRARMAAAGRSVRQSLERSAADLRALLGHDGFAKYERFEKMQPDRESVKQLSPKFASAGLELSGDQQAELLAVMSAQRANFALQDFGDPMKIDYGRFDETFSEENTSRYFREKQLFHERVAQEAQRTLTPDQVALLRNALATELQRAKFTVRSTRVMMGQTR